MLLAGFQRREKKFASFPELVATINKVSQSEVTRIGTPNDYEPRVRAKKGISCVIKERPTSYVRGETRR